MTWVVWPLVKFLVAFVIAQGIVAGMNWVERRLLGLFQARLGPNRVGPFGLFQIIADPVKFLLKEDIVPASAERTAYFLGPMIPVIPALTVLCLIPFGPPPTYAVTSVNVGLLMILALTSTGVYGIILGGWASNNKYSLMGGLRSAAQMVSYEVPFGLSIVGVLMLTGTLDLAKIVKYQEAGVWNLLPQVVASFLFLVAMTAESNRTPFDLPEAESELVAGYHTEYSAMKFAFYMLGEYAMMIVNSCLMVCLFLGGWTLAMGGRGLTSEVLMSWGVVGGILAITIFFAKVMAVLLTYVWFRATFPRFRFDQLMDLGWKFLIPLALVNIAVTGVAILSGLEWLLSVFGVVVILTAVALVLRPTPRPQRVTHASRISEA
jgi:NADH-quinone oxidoreductase subunit H